jgi:hypothetical protein
MVDQPIVRPLRKQETQTQKKARTYIHASSGIRNPDSSVRASTFQLLSFLPKQSVIIFNISSSQTFKFHLRSTFFANRMHSTCGLFSGLLYSGVRSTLLFLMHWSNCLGAFYLSFICICSIFICACNIDKLSPTIYRLMNEERNVRLSRVRTHTAALCFLLRQQCQIWR